MNKHMIWGANVMFSLMDYKPEWISVPNIEMLNLS